MQLAKFQWAYFDLSHVQLITTLDYVFTPETRAPDKDGIEAITAAHGHARFQVYLFGREPLEFKLIINSQEPRYTEELRWNELSNEKITELFTSFKQGYEQLFEAWSNQESSITVVKFGD
jgi:hypothetical protein